MVTPKNHMQKYLKNIGNLEKQTGIFILVHFIKLNGNLLILKVYEFNLMVSWKLKILVNE